MRKVVVILGQTAAGKSALAVRAARKFGGEIISADSRQVYRGLDIGTGKITRAEMRGVPHHLLDVADPRKKFTVAEYKTLAEEKIKEITARGRIPIICGGTGFYIDAVAKGLVFPQVPPNGNLRKILEGKSAPELFKALRKLDARRAKNIDAHNKVRLIRAIEIATYLGKVPSVAAKKSSYQFIKIGLTLPRAELQKKIEKRVAGMFRKGLLKEIAVLKKKKVSAARLRELGFEYDNPTPEKVIRGTIQYAKRQMTWWKRDEDIRWFRPDEEKKILAFLAKEMKDQRRER